MGYSINKYPYAGSNEFDLNFTLGYINRSDVFAYVQDELDTQGSQVFRDITWLDNNRVRVSGTFSTGDTVVLQRVVSKQALVIDFETEGTATRQALNTGFKQAIMAVHELYDGALADTALVTATPDAVENALRFISTNSAAILAVGAMDATDLEEVSNALQAVEFENFTTILNQTTAAKTGAENAATQALAARDAAIIGAVGMYADTAAGIAGTTADDYFITPAASTLGALDVWQHNTAEPGNLLFVSTYPSLQYLQTIADSAENLKVEFSATGFQNYVGNGPLWPLVVDNSNNVLLGYDQTNEKIVGFDLHGADAIKDLAGQLLGDGGIVRYTGNGPVWPIVTTKSGQVLLGYDENQGIIVGAGLSVAGVAASAPTSKVYTPLANPPVKAALNHMLFYGQSLSVGAAAGQLLSTTALYSNLTFAGGPRAWNGLSYDWLPLKGLVEDETSPAPDGGGNRKETACSGAANYATTLAALSGKLPSENVILASTAGHGGYRIDQLEQGTAWWEVFKDHIDNGYAANNDYALQVVPWLQGENDVIGSITREQYKTKLNQLRTDATTYAQSVTGQTHPVYMLSYNLSWNARTDSKIALAQIDADNADPYTFVIVPTYILPHAGDNVHLTAVGYKWIGAYFGRAWHQIVQEQRVPDRLKAISATVRNGRVTVKFDVPQAPLVLDTSAMAATTDYGFCVKKSGASLPLSNFVAGSDSISFDAQGVDNTCTVRYGLDYTGAGLTLTGGGSGNLRDSTTDNITIAGAEYPLWHAALHFELPAITLGE